MRNYAKHQYRKRHYEQFAKLLMIQPAGTGMDTWQTLVKAIADLFASDSGDFDRFRFYEACGLVQPEPTKRGPVWD